MTARGLCTAEADVLQVIAAAHSVFCFVDYDGTLARLAPTPDAAKPLPGAAALLQALAAAPRTQVALVTGRTIANLRSLLDVPGIYYVGIHGLEIEFPDGIVEWSESVAVVRSVLPAIKQQIAQALGSRPGVLIEDKGLALAYHYRLASRADAAATREVVQTVAERTQRDGAPIAVMHGHEVAEIRSAFANKGRAVCQLLAAHAPAALAVYIGDDQTDEDAFRLLPPESITIRVGPATVPTAARYRVADPDEVLRLLRAIVEQRRGRELGSAPGLGG
jgi:trehalose 6-phosphate phosphatase